MAIVALIMLYCIYYPYTTWIAVSEQCVYECSSMPCIWRKLPIIVHCLHSLNDRHSYLCKYIRTRMHVCVMLLISSSWMDLLEQYVLQLIIEKENMIPPTNWQSYKNQYFECNSLYWQIIVRKGQFIAHVICNGTPCAKSQGNISPGSYVYIMCTYRLEAMGLTYSTTSYNYTSIVLWVCNRLTSLRAMAEISYLVPFSLRFHCASSSPTCSKS